jgi:predicted transcriptional regulator
MQKSEAKNMNYRPPPTSIRLPPEVAAELQLVVAKLNVPTNRLLVQAVRDLIKQNKSDQAAA